MPAALTNDLKNRALLTLDATPSQGGVTWSASVTDGNPSWGGWGYAGSATVNQGATWTVNIGPTQPVNESRQSYDFGSGVVSSPRFPRSIGNTWLPLDPGTYTASSTFFTTGEVGTASVSFQFTVPNPPPPATPVWSTGTSLTAATRGTAYSRTVTASPVTSYSREGQSGGTGTYTVTQSGSNAIISGTPSATGTASVTVRANNSGSTADRTFTFTVNPATPVFSDTTLAVAIRDASYSDAVSASETSSTGYSRTGTIPPGLTFNSNGTITGTPTTIGSFPFTVSATNVTGTTSANVTLVVNRPTPVYTDSTVSSSSIFGVAYSDSVRADDATNYAVNSGSLPPGISLNSETGAVTGTPTAVGSYTFVIRASNETGGVNTSSQTINVISPVRVNTAGPDSDTPTFVTGAVRVNTATGTTPNFVPGVVRVWNGTAFVPSRLT
jgi:hypothetical protein